MRLSMLSRRLTLLAPLLPALAVVKAVAVPLNTGSGLGVHEQSHVPPNGVPILSKRLQNTWQSFLGPDGWQVSYVTYAHLVPIQAAAFGLQDLYSTIAVSAFTNQWALQPPSNAIVITVGSFTLTLASNEKIPWALLHAFAARMWTISAMGFTPGYTITFESPNGTKLKATLSVEGFSKDALNPSKGAPPPKPNPAPG